MCFISAGIMVLFFSIINLYLTQILAHLFEHPKDPVLTFEESIESLFICSSCIFTICAYIYTLYYTHKNTIYNKTLFYQYLIKFFSMDIFGLISVFSISFGFIDKALYGLVSKSKLTRRLMSLSLDNSLSLTFMIPAIAFVALCVATYCYEHILVNKDNEQRFKSGYIKY